MSGGQIRISELPDLPEGESIELDDIVILVHAGSTYKIPVGILLSIAGTSFDSSSDSVDNVNPIAVKAVAGMTVDQVVGALQGQYNSIASYLAKSTTYTVLATDNTIDCTGTFTLSLPVTDILAGSKKNIINSGSGTITIASESGTIGGYTNKILNVTGSMIEVEWTGTTWIVIR